MPAPTNPPYSAGAVMQPRMLQRWLDINKVSALRRAQTYFTVPAFNIAHGWEGYSNLLAVFNYTATNNFSLKLPITTFPTDPNYIACIAWIDSNRVMHRYKLWQGVGEVFFFNVPLYDRQLIKKNFRIEIWSVNTLFQVTIAGAGTAYMDGVYATTDGISWGHTAAAWSIQRYAALWVMQTPSTGMYQSVDMSSYFPLGPWTATAGAAPAPTTTAITLAASQTASFNIFTSAMQAYDYRYRTDTTVAVTPTIVTTLPNVLPLVLPAVFPVNSTPTLN